jgi:hypothetical protein
MDRHARLRRTITARAQMTRGAVQGAGTRDARSMDPVARPLPIGDAKALYNSSQNAYRTEASSLKTPLNTLECAAATGRINEIKVCLLPRA